MKGLTMLCVSLIAIGLALTGVSSAKVKLEDAIAVWLFDEGKGDITKDVSGNGNDGKLKGGVKWVDGKFGKALEFNGKDACVSTEKKLLDSLDALTIVLWAKPGDIVASRVGLIGQNDAVEFGFINPNTVQYWTPTTHGVNATYRFPKKEWHHIAAVASSSGSAVYLDGEEAAKGSPGKPETSSYNVNIGGCGVFDPSGNWFIGILDEVAIFKVALEEDEIKEIMNKGLGAVLGITAVSPDMKLTTTWGRIKEQSR